MNQLEIILLICGLAAAIMIGADFLKRKFMSKEKKQRDADLDIYKNRST